MMLSSSGRHEDVERCRSLGIAACLTKPISSGDLLGAIRDVDDLQIADGESSGLQRTAQQIRAR